jgi:glyoxylase-like metal-dependent hydrolase (beta-lactamase superfamily II)
MMTIEIKRLTLGVVSTHAYVVGDTETNEALVIDPVDEADTLIKAATDSGWAIKLILATHAHFDHVLASKELKEKTGALFWIHEDCTGWLKMLPQMGQMFGLGEFPDAAEPDRLLKSVTETIELGAIKLVTFYTPGHAPGHLAFYMRDHSIVFAGDTLFFSSIGRTDLPGGDHELLMESIREKLLTLPDETQILAGHMQETTVGIEREHNPFL